ncbi:hypothetical protein HUE87_04675 [Candidatus Sulfurimonas marisnigri]|uniref:Uncharacterized protein n=1 Tax=Candidatus Sulfurimonas marisnigri TaxID=2740405 RepID=A0A7S7M2Z9_9BACT|nr:hypothetical protein [Candidatus Sulfurimonas marisnigri]QOY55534.1 hypothetical protein HUE87_04675 [Candidatus Sulfurimonas marisnigri]
MHELDEPLNQYNLHQAITSDSIYEYMKWKFPDIKLESYDEQLKDLESGIRLDTLDILDELLERAKPFYEKIKQHMGSSHSAGGFLAYSYAMIDKDWVKDNEYYNYELRRVINSEWEEEDLALIVECREKLNGFFLELHSV